MSPRAREDELAVDFDGVLHEYRGWQGNDVISEPPVPGAIEWLNEVSSKFKVVIYSARAETAGGTKAIREWLKRYGAERLIPITGKKPHFAIMYVDDRGYHFDGKNFPTPAQIKSFRPWWKHG